VPKLFRKIQGGHSKRQSRKTRLAAALRILNSSSLTLSIFLQSNPKSSQLGGANKIIFTFMKNFFQRHGCFAGLAAAILVMAGCRSSQMACCPMPVSASTSGVFVTPSMEASAIVAPPPPSKETQAAMTPDEALDQLKKGNDRFVSGHPFARNLPAEVKATASGQYPFAVVLSCLDSRQPVEMVFDQGIGDLFSARVAGNVLNDDILGSMEFACKVSGAKLIAVVGHSNCGAIKGAIDDVDLGNLTGLLTKIKPAIDAVPATVQPRNSKNYSFVDQVSEANVRLVLKEIPERSPILREMIDKGEIKLVGGMYDLTTGKVQFYDN
jgi:carbonic anhydrase